MLQSSVSIDKYQYVIWSEIAQMKEIEGEKKGVKTVTYFLLVYCGQKNYD